MIRQPTAIDIGLLAALALIWGSAFTAIEVAIAGVSALHLTAARAAIGFAVLLPFALARREPVTATVRQFGLIVAIALLNVVIPFWLIASAQATITAGATALLMGVGPVLSLIVAHFSSGDDRITVRKVLAVLLGGLGVALITLGDVGAQDEGRVLAIASVVAASACYVASGALARRIVGVSSIALSTMVLAVSALALLPVALLVDGAAVTGTSWDAVMALVYLGAVPTGLAYLLRYHLIRTVGLSRFSISMNLVPVSGLMLGAAVLGEEITLAMVSALLLVVSSFYLATTTSRAPPPSRT